MAKLPHLSSVFAVTVHETEVIALTVSVTPVPSLRFGTVSVVDAASWGAAATLEGEFHEHGPGESEATSRGSGYHRAGFGLLQPARSGADRSGPHPG